MKQVKKQRRKKGEPKLYSEKEKEYIQGTNDSSIVSKYSAERIYSSESISYFTPFVGEDRVRRRSPIINRGYWLRMQCVEHVVRCFLSDCNPARRKVVVNLGCGYDPLPFQFLSQGFRDNIIYVDIDYPALISIKAQKVATDPLLTPLLHNIHLETAPTDNAHIRLRSDEYFAIGCDLEQLDWLNALFEKEGFLSSEILFTAEVSVTYMRTEPANALINWAAGLPKAKFSLLEQIIPDGPQNPFARTMLKHFDTLKTPLQSVKKYPTLQDQVNRFISNRWHSVHSSDLLGFWTNTITKSEKEHLWSSEGFDEWEEFYLFAQHYCLLLADNNEAGTGLQNQFFKPVAGFDSIKGGDVFSSHKNSASNEKADPIAQEQVFNVKTIGTQSKKFLNRFGATDSLTKGMLLHHGGLSISGRIGTVAKISCDGIITEEFPKDSSPKARMCHTFTRIDQHTVLLYGGRISPTQVLGDTWIFDGQQWKLVSPEAESFPSPRFRHCAVSNEVQKNVLIFGGIGEGQKILGDWHVFNYKIQRWTQLNVVSHSGDVPSPRFSASMCAISEDTALLVGGISEDGVVLHDMWKVTWSDSQVITECITLPPDAAKLLWRFGAQLVKTTESEVLFIGGVSGGSLMRKSETVVVINLKDGIQVEGAYGLSMELSPLLVGFTARIIGETVVLVGGGAVCFSFGAEWNGDLLAISRGVKKMETAIYKESIAQSPAPGSKLADIQTPDSTSLLNDGPKPFPILNNIQRIRISSENDFAALLTKDEPVILEGIGFGSCVEKWNWEYLKTQVGVDRQIIVHSSSTSQMSFTTKNFTYEKTTFGAFVDAISNSTSSSTPGLYLRSLSSTSPTKHPANLTIDFPNLSQDFEIPPELSFVKEHLHSSPLRISSANVGMWLHFDVTANVLFHVSGTKRFRLWHPRRALELGFPPGGSSSATLLDPFADLSSTPASDSNAPLIPPDYDIILSPGSALYIPPVYPHAALPLSPCVAVNVFFKDLPKERYAPGKDVYGNRDLAAYEKGRLAVQKVLKEFEGLPEWVRRFYLERLGAEVIDAARKE